MRRFLIVPIVLLLALAVWLWLFGGEAQIARHAADAQHLVQNAMAGALRRLKAGDFAATTGLWALCFAYGFLHAAGPGHGKVVVAGYGLGRRVPMARLVGLAVAASLAQAAAAIALVYAGVLILGWGREKMQVLADDIMGPVSQALIAGLGLWLIWRGLRGLRRAQPHSMTAVPADSYLPMDHDHQHLGDGAICPTCGHAHGPTLAQVEAVRSPKDAALVIATIAVRPCTGALFLLLLTWRMGIDWAGIIGALVMGLGTASTTALVAAGSVALRESTLAQVASAPGTARMMSIFALLAGSIVFAVSLRILLL